MPLICALYCCCVHKDKIFNLKKTDVVAVIGSMYASAAVVSRHVIRRRLEIGSVRDTLKCGSCF